MVNCVNLCVIEMQMSGVIVRWHRGVRVEWLSGVRVDNGDLCEVWEVRSRS
jgi:hypothetical protein